MPDGVWNAARRQARATSRDRREGAPPGWASNPSSWSGRVPEVVLALVGAAIATWLALFQLRAVAFVWEPFFGGGTRAVLTSSVARAFPIPDASLGVLGYLADAVLGVAGGSARWRHQPWLVWLFFVAVLGSAAAGVALTILQGAVVGRWCTLCLASAAISLVLLRFAWPEFLASWRWVRGRMAAGAGTREALAGR